MRLFVALDIDEEIRCRIVRFIEGVAGFAPAARWVKPESLHVTLKFIGESGTFDTIKTVLAAVTMSPSTVSFSGAGFFPTPRAPRVFWIGIHADENLVALAAAVDKALQPCGIAAENRPYTPHLTLARTGSGAPSRQPDDRVNLNFQRLQEKLAVMPAPAFGTMTAREFFLYRSQTAPSGAVYTKQAKFELL